MVPHAETVPSGFRPYLCTAMNKVTAFKWIANLEGVSFLLLLFILL